MFVMSVSLLPLLCFGQHILRYADKRIANIMKVYIKRNNMQVELIRCRKNVDFIYVYFCETRNSMQYRPPNANQEVSNTNYFGTVSESN